MPGDKTRDLRKVNRRSFLRKLSAMGVSGAALQYMTKDTLAEVTDDPSDEVPYVAYLRGNPPEREPIYKTINREEWERRHTAIDVREKIGKKVDQMDESGLTEVVYTAVDESPTGFGVEVWHRSKYSETQSVTPDVSADRLRSRLPDKMTGVAGDGDYRAEREGIPIIIREKSQEISTRSSSNCMDRSRYWGDTPAGVPMRVSGGSLGTLCAPFESDQEGYGIIASGHVAETVGKTIKQGGEDIGKVTFSRKPGLTGNVDFAHVSRNDGNLDKAIAEPNNYPVEDYDIAGIVPDTALQNEVDNQSYKLSTQGLATCRQEGYITGLTYLDTAVFTNGTAVEKGDSGGPLFNKDDELGIANIAGVISERREDVGGPSEVGAKSTTAQTVENGDFSGHFLV